MQCLEKVPAENAKVFYLMYADFEEKHGLARRAMYVYDRATRNVAAGDKVRIRIQEEVVY